LSSSYLHFIPFFTKRKNNKGLGYDWLTGGEIQVKGDKKFDVEKYWTSKKFKALFDHSVDLNIKPVGERKEMGTAEGYAKEYQGVIGAHPEESLRSRR